MGVTALGVIAKGGGVGSMELAVGEGVRVVCVAVGWSVGAGVSVGWVVAVGLGVEVGSGVVVGCGDGVGVESGWLNWNVGVNLFWSTETTTGLAVSVWSPRVQLLKVYPESAVAFTEIVWVIPIPAKTRSAAPDMSAVWVNW